MLPYIMLFYNILCYFMLVLGVGGAMWRALSRAIFGGELGSVLAGRVADVVVVVSEKLPRSTIIPMSIGSGHCVLRQ